MPPHISSRLGHTRLRQRSDGLRSYQTGISKRSLGWKVRVNPVNGLAATALFLSAAPPALHAPV